MDFFSKLPAELRVMILSQLYFQSDALLQLIQASPAMFRQYNSSTAHILRSCLTRHFDDSLINDAMAVVLFPQPSSSSFSEHAHSINRHLQSWDAQTLPNPIRGKDLDGMMRLGRLFKTLRVYIQDYLAKATAAFPPRAYLWLPNPNGSQLTFKGKKISNGFDMDDLSQDESFRLLRAFLWFELRCKLDEPYPLPDKALGEMGCDRLRHHANSAWVRRVYKIPNWEVEAIICVSGYVRSLYDTLFAQCGDIWLPYVPTCATPPLGSTRHSPLGLLFPDNICFTAGSWKNDAYLQGMDLGPLVQFSHGLDPITNMLAAITGQRAGFSRFKKWLYNFNDVRRPRTRWHGSHVLTLPRAKRITILEPRHWQNGPGVSRILRFRLLPQIPQNNWRNKELGTQQRTAFRQRAWVFFDDARFYPNHDLDAHFPAIMELKRQNDLMQHEYYLAPDVMRAQRRSQKWHDDFDEISPAGIVEEDDGGVKLEVEDRNLSPPRFFDERRSRKLIPFWL